MTWNFTEVVMNANEVNPENLVAVRLLWEIHLYEFMDGPISTLQALDYNWSVHKFTEVNFSKLTDNNQIFRNDWLHSLSPVKNVISNYQVQNFCSLWYPWNELYNYLLYANPGPRRPVSAVCKILCSNVRGLAANLSDLTVASSQYDILWCSETVVLDMNHV